MDSDEDEEEDSDDEDDDDDDDDDDEDDVKEKKPVAKNPVKTSQKTPEKKKSADKQNGSPSNKAGMSQKPKAKTPQKVKASSTAGPSGKAPVPPNLSEVKTKLSSIAKEGKPLPKTEQKFENYARSSFKISDKQDDIHMRQCRCDQRPLELCTITKKVTAPLQLPLLSYSVPEQQKSGVQS
ncbi:hypothetical protein DNTS_010312 [Danionella cerebrum]|uniref:Nucleophosmin C-terminal domain-containing protein n=1 Tax=Danionella cerebrum TaxID=2873325 RepID=A0A553Q537_9TELE|nr:hypothetical protein DNTS_010312 [Danionella translucida]